MDIAPKVFDCITHNLLITKLHAYEPSFEMTVFLNLYLKTENKRLE